MPRLRLGRSMWLALDAPADPSRYAPLRRDLDVDVVVVGGGITGAVVAWRFADAGLRVALLEAARVGRGSTAASTALLMQEPDEDLTRLSKRYGAARARRIWELSRFATEDFVSTIAALEIDCRLSHADSIYYALEERDATRLRAEQRRRHAAGVGGRWLDRREVHHAAGFDAAGAIRTRGNAQVEPYLACLGFLRAAIASGACVFERSPAGAITASRDGVTVRVGRATVRARQVVIATGYATPSFKPLAGRFRLLNTYVGATRRLSAAERRGLGLGPVMLWDTGRPYHYARWTPDHRLLMGGADRPVTSGRTREQARRAGIDAVHRYFIGLLPRLADVELEFGWDGLFAMTPDSLPYIGPHRHYPRHLFALGYGGNGMTLGFLAAGLLLEMYLGRRTPDHDLFAFGR